MDVLAVVETVEDMELLVTTVDVVPLEVNSEDDELVMLVETAVLAKGLEEVLEEVVEDILGNVLDSGTRTSRVPGTLPDGRANVTVAVLLPS